MQVHRRVTPGIKFAGTHLNTLFETCTARVKCQGSNPVDLESNALTSMKKLGIFLLRLGWDAGPSQHRVTLRIKFG